MIEIKADVHLSLGYFEHKGDEWKNSLSMREKAISWILDKAPEKAEQAQNVIKDNSMALMQKAADKMTDLGDAATRDPLQMQGPAAALAQAGPMDRGALLMALSGGLFDRGEPARRLPSDSGPVSARISPQLTQSG